MLEKGLVGFGPGIVSARRHLDARVAELFERNDERASCHYSAQQINTVLAELNARKGEYFHIVGIKILPDEAIRVITIGDLYHAHKTGHTRTLGLDPGNSFSKKLNSYPLEKGQTVVYIDAFLAGLLADREAEVTDYLITRRSAFLAFQRSEALGMFYPSVPTSWE